MVGREHGSCAGSAVVVSSIVTPWHVAVVVVVITCGAGGHTQIFSFDLLTCDCGDHVFRDPCCGAEG